MFAYHSNVFVVGFLAGLLAFCCANFHSISRLLEHCADISLKQPQQILKLAQEKSINKDFSRALFLYKRYLQIRPRDAQALAGLSYCYNGMENYQEALVTAERALAVSETELDALSNKAWALNHLNRFEERLAAADQTLSLDSNNGEGLCDRGEALLGLKRYDEALAAFNKHCRIHYREYYAYSTRARAHELMGHTELAKRDRKTADSCSD